MGKGEVKYDVRAVFEKIPQLMGMELTLRGGSWEGGYYLNGDRHSWRRDKLKVFKFKGGIWVSEEGGQTMALPTWMQQYGGAADYWDAIRILKGTRAPLVMERMMRENKEEVKYVDPEVLAAAKRWDLKKCPLFRWMCQIFGEERVRRVWELYNVTTDANGNAVFWSMDAEGRILHDKRMAYLTNGHRDKNFGGSRVYTTAKGYSGRCLFGAHLAKGKVRVVESEKSALLAALYTGKVFLATGGKNGLRDVDSRMILYPDMDAIEEWSAKKGANIEQWWLKWNGVTDHADYADYIEYLWRQNGGGVLKPLRGE